MAKGVKTGGRVAGTPNKATAALKDAILAAGHKVGEDGEGRGGLEGYLVMLAKTDPKSFSTLLGKVLPLQVKMDAIVQMTHEQALAELAE